MQPIGWSVYDILQLLLADVAEFSLDVIYKDLNLTQVFLQKDFKFGLDRGHQGFRLNLPLMLLLPIQSSFFEERSGKRDLVAVSELRRSKIVFAIL